MKKGFMFYDDETAASNAICAIGYILCDLQGNMIKPPVYQLIDPGCEFDRVCQGKHGISLKDVQGKPSFAEFCETNGFLQLLSDYCFVAHNAVNADLSHIHNSLAWCNLEMPVVHYVDTCQLTKADSGIGSLEEACHHYGIELKGHHHALYDALACRELFLKLAKREFHPTRYDPSQHPLCANRPPPRFDPTPEKLGFVAAERGGGAPTCRTLEDVLEEFSHLNLRGNPANIITLDCVELVLTGAIPGYSDRDDFKKELREYGVELSEKVKGKTKYLVLGNGAGPKKLDAAKTYHVPVITAFELLDTMKRVGKGQEMRLF